MRETCGVAQIVHADDLDGRLPRECRPQEHTADPSEAIDANSYAHGCSFTCGRRTTATPVERPSQPGGLHTVIIDRRRRQDIGGATDRSFGELPNAATKAPVALACGFSASTIRRAPDGAGPRGRHCGASMNRSYAITWQEPGGAPHSGKLEVRASGIRLEGRNGEGPVSLLVPYADLVGLRVAPSRERLGGRPTLVLGRSGGSDIRVASVGAAGV